MCHQLGEIFLIAAKIFGHYYSGIVCRLSESFVYHGETMRNHNHLLGAVEGMDGIKTGYTRASGFNLVASVHRDGRRIVAVILGGKSSFERDVHMRRLISAHIQDAALRHTSPVIYPDRSLVSAKGKLMTDVVDPVLPVVVKTFTVQTAPQQAILSGSSPAATPTMSPDASEPSAQVAARWPSTAEVFTFIAGSPSVDSGSYRSASPVLPADSPVP